MLVKGFGWVTAPQQTMPGTTAIISLSWACFRSAV